MTSLDTNVILRFLLRDVAYQAVRAVRLLDGSQCYVTDVVLTETIFVLEKVYEAPRAEIASIMKLLTGWPNLICNRSLMNEVIALFDARPSLSIVDCYAAVEAETFQNQLATFDKKLLKHGGRHVVEA